MANLDTRQSGHSTQWGSPVRDGAQLGRQEEIEREDVHPPREHVRKNLKGLVGDAAKLADLQLQLFTVDIQDFWSSAKAGLVLIIVASLSLVSGLIVLAFGISSFLQTQLEWSEYAANFFVGLSGIAIASALLFWAVKRITYASGKLVRSKEELSSNLAWLRETFTSDD